MKILIATYGSRGDVQPYIALGKKLQAAGHQVILGTSERFRGFVEGHGLEYAYMGDGLLAIIDTDQGRDLLENATNIFNAVIQNIKLMKQLKPLQIAVMRDTWDIAKKVKPDFILYHPKTSAAVHIAEKLGIGCALATPLPMFVPTSERPFFVLPNLKMGGWYNRLSYKIIAVLTKIFLGKYIKDFRKGLGLMPLKKFDFLKKANGEDIVILHAFSKAVHPRPTDWPDSAYITGYWFLEREKDWVPPKSLQTFLEAGDPPVYVGFGSMAGHKPQWLAKVVIEALQLAGVRGIIATCWGGMVVSESLPDSILKIDGAPHDWLFPRVSVVVHHGGAGTTAAGLRAGKPSIIIPFFADQPYWGQQIQLLGVGSKPIPLKKLTADKLAKAIKEVISNTDIKRKAQEIGEKIRQEDGVGNAVAIIETIK